MAAQVLSISDYIINKQRDNSWRERFFEKLNQLMDEMEKTPMTKLGDITDTIFHQKSQILGQMALGIIESKFSELLEQEHMTCPVCGKTLKSRGRKRRQLETQIGKISFERPFFYCPKCKQGYYPMDEVLGLSSSPKQYDVQSVEAWLASELPFETAAEAYQRCTGETLSAHHIHECTREIAQCIDILDVCPSKEEIEAKVDELGQNKFRRPVMMLAIDGGHTPTRREPCFRDEKRGKGEWKEAKGFRLYLIDERRIEHVISWHQIGDHEELARDLEIIKEAGLIPEDKVRLCLIGDGAPWIWNRIGEMFPAAKEILDYYHCSEHLHAVANSQYGKDTREAQEWVEVSLARLFHHQADHIIVDLRKTKPASSESAVQIKKLIRYLTEHKDRVDYRAARRGGYHIGSGAIESANKFIGHVRLKRSGAWWYTSLANNILKLRCAKYNGTYDRIIHLYKNYDQKRFLNKIPIR